MKRRQRDFFAGRPGAMAAATDEAKFPYRAKQGRPAPLVEIRARNEDGPGNRTASQGITS